VNKVRGLNMLFSSRFHGDNLHRVPQDSKVSTPERDYNQRDQGARHEKEKCRLSLVPGKGDQKSDHQSGGVPGHSKPVIERRAGEGLPVEKGEEDARDGNVPKTQHAPATAVKRRDYHLGGELDVGGDGHGGDVQGLGNAGHWVGRGLLGHREHHILPKQVGGVKDPEDVVHKEAAEQDAAHLEAPNFDEADSKHAGGKPKKVVQQPVPSPEPGKLRKTKTKNNDRKRCQRSFGKSKNQGVPHQDGDTGEDMEDKEAAPDAGPAPEPVDK